MKKTFFALTFVAMWATDVEAGWREVSMSGLSVATPNATQAVVSLRVSGLGDGVVAQGSMTATARNHEGTVGASVEIDEIAPGLNAGGEANASKQVGQPPVIEGSSYGGAGWSGFYNPTPPPAWIPLEGAWNW